MRQHGIPADDLNRDFLVARPANRWRLLANGSHIHLYVCWKSRWLGSQNAISNKEQKMSTISNTVAIPADDPRRNLVVANPDNSNAQHLAVVGDTYTILLSGMDTAGRFTLIDMHVPPGGGPPPHRHDFEETFVLLDGELQATFRGEKRIVRWRNSQHSSERSSPIP
jgi:mannose-6-phosphate isomerase-like protein (cupin superfamily)